MAKVKTKKAAKIAGEEDPTELSDDPAESSDDEEEHKEVFTLGCIGTRSQTRVN
jgi:hypothetical protein